MRFKTNFRTISFGRSVSKDNDILGLSRDMDKLSLKDDDEEEIEYNLRKNVPDERLPYVFDNKTKTIITEMERGKNTREIPLVFLFTKL